MRVCSALLLAASTLCLLPAADLREATIIPPPGTLSVVEKNAVSLLVEEIERRTQVRLPVGGSGKLPVRLVRATVSGRPAEGYTLRTSPTEVVIEGNDARGLLFGAGHLLRLLRMSRQSITVPDGVRIDTSPRYALRGHQLGFRPKTNSYDGWTLPMWRQYIRDLAVFGTNAIELIPPRSDDDADSPHFPKPPMEMMIGMSQAIADHGMDVWIWYPALDKDYSDPATVEFALKEWGEVFRKLPRVDHLFVPGGDPGHTQPRYLMALLEKQTANLRKYHPKAKMWVAPQGFSQAWLEEFYGIVRKEPAWLEGIVFGPQVRVSLKQLRADIPKRYPIRHYPDITHSIRSQYSVPDWDLAYAMTLGREGINPRPHDQAAIFRLLQPLTNGFLAYSEGCNDDVNKIIWSVLGWNPDADIEQALVEYSRYFVGPHVAHAFAEGLLALERNWRSGPLLGNAGVDATLGQFQAMERTATPQDKLNWRWQQAMYRAYYDAHVRTRLISETAAEQNAMEVLRAGGDLDAAERALDAAPPTRATALRARVFELAEALYQSIRMQLSVPRYRAIAVGRGANLDAIDVPLSNAPWLRERFAAIRAMGSAKERREAIDEILNWTSPGPGSFYDDLGSVAMQPHLVRTRQYEEDPAHLESPLMGFAINPDATVLPWRTSWLRHAETMNDSKLSLAYRGLDPEAAYKLRVVYAGENSTVEIRCTADGKWEVHPFRKRDRPVKPVEFDIPKEATADGRLTLTWERPPSLGGNGRGMQVSEVWLIRK